jgi:hypothetical protein
MASGILIIVVAVTVAIISVVLLWKLPAIVEQHEEDLTVDRYEKGEHVAEGTGDPDS